MENLKRNCFGLAGRELEILVSLTPEQSTWWGCLRAADLIAKDLQSSQLGIQLESGFSGIPGSLLQCFSGSPASCDFIWVSQGFQVPGFSAGTLKALRAPMSPCHEAMDSGMPAGL